MKTNEKYKVVAGKTDCLGNCKYHVAKNVRFNDLTCQYFGETVSLHNTRAEAEKVAKELNEKESSLTEWLNYLFGS